MARRGKGGKTQGGGREGAGRGFYIGLAVLVVAGVAALVVAGRSRDEPATRPLSVAELDAGADPAAGVATGPEDAPVMVLEFTDFQCPVCKQFNALTGRLLRQSVAGPEGPARWISYDFPLDQHANALPAALAARCAEAQGRYWEMHDLLLARQEEWASDDTPTDRFVRLARELGLDTGAFETCLAERRYIDRVVASRRFGEQLGVSGTPTIFVNGEPVRERSYVVLEEKIRSLAAGAADGGRGEGR